MPDPGLRWRDGQAAEPPGGKCSPRRGRRFVTVVQAAVGRWATTAESPGGKCSPRRGRRFLNRLIGWLSVAPGARRGDGKPGCRAASVPVPGGNGAAAGMGAGFYIGCSFWYGVMRLIGVVRFGFVRFGGVRWGKVVG